MAENIEDFPLFDGDHYRVEIDPEAVGEFGGVLHGGLYVVVNNLTGISEYYTPCLPEALRYAVNAGIAIENEHHLWPLKHKQMEIEFTPEQDDNDIPLPGELAKRLDA